MSTKLLIKPINDSRLSGRKMIQRDLESHISKYGIAIAYGGLYDFTKRKYIFSPSHLNSIIEDNFFIVNDGSIASFPKRLVYGLYGKLCMEIEDIEKGFFKIGARQNHIYSLSGDNYDQVKIRNNIGESVAELTLPEGVIYIPEKIQGISKYGYIGINHRDETESDITTSIIDFKGNFVDLPYSGLGDKYIHYKDDGFITYSNSKGYKSIYNIKEKSYFLNYLETGSFSEGKCLVKLPNGEYSVINESGKEEFHIPKESINKNLATIENAYFKNGYLIFGNSLFDSNGTLITDNVSSSILNEFNALKLEIAEVENILGDFLFINFQTLTDHNFIRICLTKSGKLVEMDDDFGMGGLIVSGDTVLGLDNYQSGSPAMKNITTKDMFTEVTLLGKGFIEMDGKTYYNKNGNIDNASKLEELELEEINNVGDFVEIKGKKFKKGLLGLK